VITVAPIYAEDLRRG